ncbi:MAG: DUF962 domain-containing protein [Chromatiales bacterium]|nr:DUF962 domain-containing protein [Chromatiales bacterium]
MNRTDERFENFEAFYPFYLSQHADLRCRRMHFAGLVFAFAALLMAALTQNAWWLLAGLVAGYGFAWIGHAAFEHNRPATFSHPWYSLRGDLRMFREMLTGRIGLTKR